ncbi:ISL3 family transposase [Streptomyces sp. NBC_00162]|uniref:ISL3 family transposase n=1 Tax=Streptomyces sp. NBC_00162 TaxID=2903629 RepID=UPI002AFEAD11|nr:ISL3 family transposase [Streptomyces sp. NBC_00162]
MFSGLSPLVIEDVTDGVERILVRARTPADSVPCPGCGAPSGRVHGYHLRTVADVSVDGRRVVVRVRVRRLVCPTRGCRHTFREQVPGVLERYQRRTTRLTRHVKAVVKELAGRAGARLLAILAMGLSRHMALRTLLRIPLPAGRVPRVIGVDDFALRRRHRYATVVIDAETHERIDVLPDRTADTLETWLREHPGVEVVCRDGSATYAEAIRRALPDAVQVGDRWHLWHNPCEAALSEVKAHSNCWATVLDAPLYDGPRAQTTLERWHHVHDLLGQGVGLLECARRLQLTLNTVKRYARADQPERMLRVPKYRASLVDPYREHLRERRAEDPAVPVLHLFEEIKALGFTGCLNLLHTYINQGRADADRSHISPRRFARMLLTRPDNLKSEHHDPPAVPHRPRPEPDPTVRPPTHRRPWQLAAARGCARQVCHGSAPRPVRARSASPRHRPVGPTPERAARLGALGRQRQQDDRQPVISPWLKYFATHTPHET